jgi:hypothetical protein
VRFKSLNVLFPSITIKLPLILQLWNMEGVFILNNSLVETKATHQDFEQFLDSNGAVDVSKLLRAFFPEETVRRMEDYITGKGSLI